MKKTIFVCDICGKDIQEPLLPLGAMAHEVMELAEYEDACNDCAITVGLLDVRKLIRNELEKAQSKAPEAPKKTRGPNKPKPVIIDPVVVKIDADHKADKPSEEGFGELDDAKLRRKVQAALSNYCTKHGADNLRPIIRATGNRVTEDTLRSMIADIKGYGIKHWVAVDTALKKLALAEINQAGGTGE